MSSETIYVRLQPGESVPQVGEEREAQGFAKWRYKVLKVLAVGQPDSEGRATVTMRVERQIIEE